MISKRLMAIVDWIEGSCLADIGCDHAYVACQAVLEHRVVKAYACDIAQGPLDNARQTIQSNHLENQVFCLLTDGMQNLPDEVDVVVIAGMGGKMIEAILENASLHPSMHFIFSPHKDAEALRRYLISHGFTIQREKYIEDQHHSYPIMDCNFIPCRENYDDFAYAYGIHPIKDEPYKSYLLSQKKKWMSLLERVPDQRRKEFEKEIEQIEKEIA